MREPLIYNLLSQAWAWIDIQKIWNVTSAALLFYYAFSKHRREKIEFRYKQRERAIEQLHSLIKTHYPKAPPVQEMIPIYKDGGVHRDRMTSEIISAYQAMRISVGVVERVEAHRIAVEVEKSTWIGKVLGWQRRRELKKNAEKLRALLQKKGN